MKLDWAQADELSAAHGDSFFVFDEARFRSNYDDLLSSFREFYPTTEIGYSYKTNYTPYLCQIIDEVGGYAEVVSEMEYELTQKLGVAGNRVIFNGPLKSEGALTHAALAGATINVDSLRDVKIIAAVSSS